jgi:peptidoglycan L-alanyl-D-glutamate endopeptidase CwlK
MYKFGERSIDRMEGINTLLIDCASEALAKSSYDMTIPWMGGLRTAEEQNAIFLEGNSQLDGHSSKSYHQSGNALDVIPVVGGYANTDGLLHFAQRMFSAWAELKEQGCANGCTLQWGGLWKGAWDKPHWQIVKL